MPYVQRSFSFEADQEAQFAADELRKARALVDLATMHAQNAARGLADDGRNEYEISERLGVTRRTVRRWLGRSHQ